MPPLAIPAARVSFSVRVSSPRLFLGAIPLLSGLDLPRQHRPQPLSKLGFWSSSTTLSSPARTRAAASFTTTTTMAPPAPKPKITLYVDIVSPFAYMAYYLLRHDPVFANCDITYIPIFLGGLMHKCGNTAPMKIKNKDKYISLERLRWSAAFSIPIAREMPPDFPALTLPTMRALAVLYAEADNGKLVAALDALYHATWVERRATHHPDVLKDVLSGVLGEAEAERVLQASATSGKKLLVTLTDDAFDAGAFGLPWMVCTEPTTGRTEGFWGVDHFGQVAQFLGLAVPKAAGEKAGWKALL